MSKPGGMRGGRTRNEDGRLRQVRADNHLETIRGQYGRPVLPGRGDTHLRTIRQRIGKSETKLVDQQCSTCPGRLFLPGRLHHQRSKEQITAG